jgi:uncharacterized repeat protein (TIGR02543 family)
MQKKHIWMRFLITALIPILAGVLISVSACDSPTSPKRDVPEKKQPDQKQPDQKPPDTRLDAVIYHGNGNTAGEVPLDTNKYMNGQEAIIMGRGNLYRVGYCFTGWNTEAGGSGVSPKDNKVTMGNNSLHLYAQWKEVFPRISAGQNFSILVTDKGETYATGYNGNGRLGTGSTDSKSTFTLVKTEDLTGQVQRVFSGTDHSFALLSNGSIAGWGQGEWGKLGRGRDNGDEKVPVTPFFSGSPGDVLKNVQHISLGRNQTALLTGAGEYWAAGTKDNGALGNGVLNGPNRENQFKLVATDIASIAAGQNYVLMVKKDGFMWIAGEGSNGKLGTGSTDNVPELRKNVALDNNNAKVFAGKTGHSMVLRKDGSLLSAGLNSSGQLGQGHNKATNYFAPVLEGETKEITDVAFVSLGDTHSMILKNDGTLLATGRNSDYQLGAPLQYDCLTPTKVLDHVAYVAAGYNHTLAVKEDGTVWATGSNSEGQLGRTGGGRNDKWTMVELPPTGASTKK